MLSAALSQPAPVSRLDNANGCSALCATLGCPNGFRKFKPLANMGLQAGVISFILEHPFFWHLATCSGHHAGPTS
eukprot:1139470-Pelagomonas_calceolata.AAC.1